MGFISMLVWFIWPVLMLAITLATPKILLNKYFKDPHFNVGRLVTFASFRTFFMRAALSCRLYLTPKAVTARNFRDLFAIIPMTVMYMEDHFSKLSAVQRLPVTFNTKQPAKI